MDEQFEQVETSDATIEDFYKETADAQSALDPKVLGAGAAIVAIGGGLLAKKFGPALKSKAEDFHKKHLEKVQQKLAKRQLKVAAKIEQLTPKEEAKTE